MEQFHCNSCGHMPTLFRHDPRTYYLTSCAHVVCGNCSRNVGHCPVCKNKCTLLEIGPNARQELKQYFVEPLRLVKDNYKRTAQVLEFQNTQNKFFNALFRKTVENHKRVVNEYSNLRNKYMELEQRALELKKENDMLKSRQSEISENYQRTQSPMNLNVMSNQQNMTLPMVNVNTPAVTPLPQKLGPMFHRGSGGGSGGSSSNLSLPGFKTPSTPGMSTDSRSRVFPRKETVSPNYTENNMEDPFGRHNISRTGERPFSRSSARGTPSRDQLFTSISRNSSPASRGGSQDVIARLRQMRCKSGPGSCSSSPFP